jgi:hypothetical protein
MPARAEVASLPAMINPLDLREIALAAPLGDTYYLA